MPVYNEERFVSLAIDAVLAQDFPDFELVISDNGSTDRTPAICQTLAARDARVRFIQQDQNHGAVWNFKHVFDCCSGEYFMWAGGHDVLLPRFVSTCVAALDEVPGVVLAYPNATAIDRNNLPIANAAGDEIDTRGDDVKSRLRKIIHGLFYCDMIYGLFRRSALAKCRHGVVCRGPDHVLLMELSLHGAIAHLPDVLMQLRVNRDSGENGATYEDFIRKQLLRLDPAAFNGKKLRPHWRWAWEHLRGVMVADIPTSTKLALIPTTVMTYWRRWHSYLYREVFKPLRES